MKKNIFKWSVCFGLLAFALSGCVHSVYEPAGETTGVESADAASPSSERGPSVIVVNDPSESEKGMAVIPGGEKKHIKVLGKEPPAEQPEMAIIPGDNTSYMLLPRKPSAYLTVGDNVPRTSLSHWAPGRHRIYNYMPDTSKNYGTESHLSEISKEISGKVYYELKDEGETHKTAKVAVVSAVPLADLKRETEFGRMMAEYLLTDLSDRNLKVTELRLGKEINILAQTGEFILSRNIGELAANTQALDYVVVSTFSNTRKTLIIQGRLVSLKDGFVRSSWRYTMPLNRELIGLFHSVEKPFTIAVKGMTN